MAHAGRGRGRGRGHGAPRESRSGFSWVGILIGIAVVVVLAVGVVLGLYMWRSSARETLQSDVMTASTSLARAMPSNEIDVASLKVVGGSDCGSSSDTICRVFTHDSGGSIGGGMVSPSSGVTLTVMVYGKLGYFTISASSSSLSGYTLTYYSQKGSMVWSPSDPQG